MEINNPGALRPQLPLSEGTSSHANTSLSQQGSALQPLINLRADIETTQPNLANAAHSQLATKVSRALDFITQTILDLYNGPMTLILGRESPKPVVGTDGATPTPPPPPEPPKPPVAPPPPPAPAKSLLPPHAQIFKKEGEISWEPAGASGMPRMRFRPSQKNKWEKVEILSPDGTQVIATGKFVRNTSNGRPEFTFDKPASEFPPGSIVMMTFKNGEGVRYTEIQNPAANFTW
jgi:hypothetical protein